MVGVLTALGSLGLAAACASSSGGSATSGEAVACGPSMYISGGRCVELPGFSDAIMAAGDGDDTSDGDDGRSSLDAMGDGVAMPAESGDAGPTTVAVDPLAPCLVDGDAFAATETTASGSVSEAFTSASATFPVKTPPPLIIAVQPLGAQFPVFALSLSGSAPPASTLPPVRMYATNAPQVTFQLAIGGTQYMGTGTITLDQIEVEQNDGAADHLRFVLLSFSLEGTQGAVAGCLRYADETAADGRQVDAGEGGSE
jgi:hypothetical protein